MSKSYNQNESDYKLLLIEHLLETSPNTPFATEVPFAFSKRRADLVIVETGCTHAIEIKSDVDNTYSLVEQLVDYQKSFNKVSVLISEKHIGILPNIPKNIGVLIYVNGKIRQRRKAKARRQLDKLIALDLLLTQDLSSLSTIKSNRVDMIKELAKKLTFSEVNELAYNSVSEKVIPVFTLFRKELGKKISAHDLEVLAMRTITAFL
ncbi:sce7726 family protein [Vibrio ostreae]|uniref:Sce7726 family protein n=1 Tax=Vibrio ostreae TaxID=2841925 RepID=A0A975U8A9_9VIBR|nr:sce7726 family protein [Vibrio ostreae]QXO16990.1 sce7726 family protein [Vibrio ostreae]